jgi:threonine dehydrogenase-like Zn-dependent dehydrogenase
MKALNFDRKLKYVTDAPIPQPVPEMGEALIRVKMAGICSTDLEITQGYMNFTGIPGHEFVGVVEECEDQDWIGRRVVGEINCPCRSCPTCRAGRVNHCSHRTVLGILGRNGAFAEYLCLPVENLHRLPEKIRDEHGVFVEPVAAAFQILQQTAITPEDRVIVIGDGRLGLITAQVLNGTGAQLNVIGHHEENLEVLRSFGIQTILEKESKDLDTADVVIDCSGSPRGFERSRKMLRPGGRLVLKSTFASLVPVNLSELVVDEITLIGSRCGPFAPAISALAKNEVEVSPLISEVFPIEQGREAFAKASTQGVLKVLLKMG